MDVQCTRHGKLQALTALLQASLHTPVEGLAATTLVRTIQQHN